MDKNIIPLKMITEFDESGAYKDSIFVYKIKTPDGKVSRKIYTISVKSKVSFPVMAGIASTVKTFATEQENQTTIIKKEITDVI